MIYEVFADGGDGRWHSFGARRDRGEAEQLMTDSQARVAAAGGKNREYEVREIDDTGMFRAPHGPPPRERYTQRSGAVDNGPDQMGGQDVTILREAVCGDPEVAGRYHRNYAGRLPFEVFRQGTREYALISPDYTATSVMDLITGEIVAAEEPGGGGFCPVGFYVPDWHDVHDGSILPGSSYWKDAYEWPRGDIGFVWGCHWGDDESWKIQVLDLSGVAEGHLKRDDRFGYVELAARRDLQPQDFIHCWPDGGDVSIRLSTEHSFRLSDGACTDWYAEDDEKEDPG